MNIFPIQLIGIVIFSNYCLHTKLRVSTLVLLIYDVNKLLHELKCTANSFEMTPFGAVKPYILHSYLSWLEFSIF